MKRRIGLSVLLVGGFVQAGSITLQSNGSTPSSCASSSVCEWNADTGSNYVIPMANLLGSAAWATAPGDGAVWISYANTGYDHVNNTAVTSTPNSTSTPFTEFFEQFTDSEKDLLLSLTVWADDTVAVYLDGNLIMSPQFTQSSVKFCDQPDPLYGLGASECANGEQILNLSIPTGTNTLEFDVYQTSGSSYGLMWDGIVNGQPDPPPPSMPEPASLALLGAGLGGLALLRRKRIF